MDRGRIERSNFSTARRGYDRGEVDEHLRQVADEVERALEQAQREAGVASSAAGQIESILDAAERSAEEMRSDAERESKRSREEGEAYAREVRERAEAHATEVRERAGKEAASYVEGVQRASDALLERAAAVESELDRLLEQLRGDASGLVNGLRAGLDSVRGELDQLRGGIPTLREGGGARPLTAAAATAAGPDPAQAEPTVRGEGEEELPAAESQEAQPIIDASEPAARDAEDETGAATGPGAVEQRGRITGSEGARLIALNMALNGTPREETARYLSENFEIDDQEAVLNDVYARVEG